MSKKITKKGSASPKVRKFARELVANIVEIPGSQRAGRVTEEDVKKFVKSQVSVNQGKIEKKIYKDEYPHEVFGKVEVKDLPRVKKLSSIKNKSLVLDQATISLIFSIRKKYLFFKINI